MLVRNDLLKPSNGMNPSCVALLSSTSDPETLLRVAAYPERGFVYCGLWWENDLLLGWSEASFAQTDDRTAIRCSVDVVGRTDMSTRLVITWQTASGLLEARASSGDAELLEISGPVVDRLALLPVTEASSAPRAAGPEQATRALQIVKNTP